MTVPREVCGEHLTIGSLAVSSKLPTVLQRADPGLLDDVSMPVVDGLQALRVIRSQSEASFVVMFSAFGDASDVARQAVRLGADGFIRKGETLSGLS